jgi:putative transposase
MARKPRLHVPGGLYHVILRGNARQDIFFTAQDRHRFYELLAEGVTRFGYRVHAFCLMTNHLHLALQGGDQPLSAGMQNLTFRYTRYLNARLKRVGHLFEGRFKAYLVDQDAYGLALVRYIHLNPVRARIVRQPAAYACSSHRAYLGREHLRWLTTDWVLGQFGSRVGIARARYDQFVNDGKAEGHNTAFYGGQADSRIVGEEDFVKAILKSKVRPRRAPALSELLTYVCRCYSLNEKELLATGRARKPAEARALLAWLVLKTQTAPLTTLARRFGRDISTLSHARSRIEERLRKSAAFAKALDRHLYAISQA